MKDTEVDTENEKDKQARGNTALIQREQTVQT